MHKIILKNWETDISGNAQVIAAPHLKNYPAWTIKFEDSYGVAIPALATEIVNENFAGANIRNMLLYPNGSDPVKVIALTTARSDIKSSFSILCASLVEPGKDGEIRDSIVADPIAWWKEWKELLGNKSVDESVYDTLGELCALKWLVNCREDAVWNGPCGASNDIETEKRFVEVKSTIVRDRREVTIHNHFQLNPPDKPLYLVLCQFEEAVYNGISIESIIEEFEQLGYNTADLEEKLEQKGLPIGRILRNKSYILHDMLLYKVDEKFPRITPEMFVGGVLPIGITKITYTVDLSGLAAESIL